MGKRLADIAHIDWCGYEGTEAVFPVCMKSPAVNGSPLRAQMQAASERLGNLVLVICDSLDRHNTAQIANATDHCVALGNVWLDANLETVREYFPKVEVIRWEQDVRTHADFPRYLKTVQRLYQSSPAVRNLRDSMSLYYLESKRKRQEKDYGLGHSVRFDVDAALKSSADYLDEEFAGDMVYYQMTAGIPHIYWGLYVDDHQIFSKESGLDLGFPQTLAVTSQRHGASLKASALPECNKDALTATAV